MSNTPSRNPSDDGTILGALRQALRKNTQGIDDMLPARVLSFNRTTNRVRVQPQIKIVTTDGSVIGRAPIASVPVMNIGGGGCILSFNLQAGDLGWIKANDRDISLFLQRYVEAEPNTARLHSFADAVFIPDVMTGWTIPGEESGRAVLQTLDGTTRISIGTGRIRLVSGSCEIEITPSGITSSGTWAHTGTFSANGVGLTTHHHGGVTTGGGNTGGPTG